MPTTEHRPLPDIAVGHHPQYGITAANPERLPAGQWMLERLDFHPVPGHPTLYVLNDQARWGQDRATRAVAYLRRAGYQVDADTAFEPLTDHRPAPQHDRPARVEPDVAFAEHPQLGIIAATANDADLGGQFLEEHGWRHNPRLDIYTLPTTTDRREALGKVARATPAMQRAGLQVAVHPHLARETAARRPSVPTTAVHNERGQGFVGTMSRVSAAARGASPTRAGLPAKPPLLARGVAAPAARPVDPRIAFTRNR
ncbi:hypothetical protein [Streptomyces odonnellii]|uniref:hypothetical protein n=1 Tax=Streptomyces odonnellii TaxID=1417980 RepID=UPI0006251FC6|nr:hypothetical protein [Streptomyces odonnellii]